MASSVVQHSIYLKQSIDQYKTCSNRSRACTARTRRSSHENEADTTSMFSFAHPSVNFFLRGLFSLLPSVCCTSPRVPRVFMLFVSLVCLVSASLSMCLLVSVLMCACVTCMPYVCACACVSPAQNATRPTLWFFEAQTNTLTETSRAVERLARLRPEPPLPRCPNNQTPLTTFREGTTFSIVGVSKASALLLIAMPIAIAIATVGGEGGKAGQVRSEIRRNILRFLSSGKRHLSPSAQRTWYVTPQAQPLQHFLLKCRRHLFFVAQWHARTLA